MKYTKESIVLHEGEILIIEKMAASKIGDIVYDTILNDVGVLLGEFNQYTSSILFSTIELNGVLHLNRKLFVKPVDVEALAHIHSEKYYFSGAPKGVIFYCFIEGYNANPNEFTGEEALALFNEGCRQGTGNYKTQSFDECVAVLRPLSIPEYIVIEDNQIKEIVWK